MSRNKPGLTMRWTTALCLLALGATAAIAQNVADRSKWPSRITFATGPVGGFAYTTGSPWASIVGADLGVPISVESTAGFPINVLMLEDRKADVGVSTSDLTYQGWEGTDWSKDKKLRAQRALVVLGANVLQIYTTSKSGIKSMSDINGRSANPSRRRSGADLVFRDVLDVLGVKPSRISNVAPSDANSLLGDGRLDVAAVSGSPPHPAIAEFDVSHEMALIGLTGAEQQKFLQKHPYLSAYEIPAGTYKGTKTPTRSVAGYLVMLVRADMPDSLAYALVKSTFDKKSTLASGHKSYAAVEAKDIVHATVPVHPGAARFYQEQGIALSEKLRAPK